ncbi:nuclear transport factor 2 family protein [Streptomyces sp. NPDC055681]
MTPAQAITQSPPADEIALRGLAERYAVALDSGNREEFLAVFTTDGTVVAHSPDGTVRFQRTGAEELVEEFDDLSAFARLFHLVGNHVAVVADDGASATATVFCEAHHYSPVDGGGGTELFCPVRYQDTYERTLDGWRIARREVHPLWYELRTVAAPRF